MHPTPLNYLLQCDWFCSIWIWKNIINKNIRIHVHLAVTDSDSAFERLFCLRIVDHSISSLAYIITTDVEGSTLLKKKIKGQPWCGAHKWSWGLLSKLACVWTLVQDYFVQTLLDTPWQLGVTAVSGTQLTNLFHHVIKHPSCFLGLSNLIIIR